MSIPEQRLCPDWTICQHRIPYHFFLAVCKMPHGWEACQMYCEARKATKQPQEWVIQESMQDDPNVVPVVRNKSIPLFKGDGIPP